MGVTGVPAAVHGAGADWWNARFGVDRVSFSAAFLPALLKSSRLELSAGDALSLDELRVIAKYCIADAAWQHDAVSLTDFVHYLARFGPVELSLQRLVESLTVRRELVPWFHGTISRADAEHVLLATTVSPPLEDGAFLVRFSDSQPARLCVSYLKIHSTGPHTGRRETRNVLIENVGQAGYVLADSRHKTYPSIIAFVQRTASRLKHGVASSLSRRCNLELADVRARQDLASNSYTTFSTDSLDPSSTSSPSSPSASSQRSQRQAALASSLLFTKSPPMGQDLLRQFGTSNNQEDHLYHANTNAIQDDEEENYSGFAKSALLAHPLPIKTSAPSPQMNRAMNGTSSTATDSSAYGSFSATAVMAQQRSPPRSPVRAQIPFITPPAGSDYGDFSAFTSAVTSFSRVTPSPSHGQQDATPSDYAAFDSFAPRRTAPVVPPTATTLAQDTYGAFELFELNGGARVPPVQPQPAATAERAPRDPSDDYGSFAALSLSDAPPPPAPSRQQRPQPLIRGNSDVYGSFTLSPLPQAHANEETVPRLTLDTEVPPPVTDTSLPPASFPVGNKIQTLKDSVAPHSLPADMAPVASSLSALEELNEGMELYKQKRLDDALLRFIRAREAAQHSQDSVVEARALGNLGTVYLEKLNPQQAVTCYRQSLELTRSIADAKRERLILNNLVLALMAAEDFVSAYNYCQIQLEMTTSDVNRRKIFTRMSELRERVARASRAGNNSIVPRPGLQAMP